MIKKSYNGIGDVVFIKKRNAKNISLRILPLEPLKITMPYHLPILEAEDFILKNIKWIKDKRKSIEQDSNSFTIFDANSNFKTRHHVLKITPVLSQTTTISISNGTINFSYPKNADIKDKRIQQFIREAIDEAWRIEAKQYIPHRLHELSQKHNFVYSGLSLKRIKSRWGSCSNRNRININVKIMQLPNPLIDYVLLHELAHIKEKNHGKSFWELLETICGGAKKLDKDLSNYSTVYF